MINTQTYICSYKLLRSVSEFHVQNQYVIYNNCISDIGIITQGVPQGSTLGPLLFIIFMSDFSKSSGLLFATFYADDSNISLMEKVVTKLFWN